MRYVDLRIEAQKYGSAVDRFIDSHQLPLAWFDYGYDHLAIKAYSPQAYMDLLQEFKPYSEFIAEANHGERYISTARLIGNYGLRLSIAELSHNERLIRYIELMLARQGEQTCGRDEFDHGKYL